MAPTADVAGGAGKPVSDLRPVQIEEGDLITVPQALRLLPVGRAYLYRLVGEGVIPSIRVASVGSRRGRVLLFRSGLNEYVRQLQAPTTRTPVRVDVDALRERIIGTPPRKRGKAMSPSGPGASHAE